MFAQAQVLGYIVKFLDRDRFIVSVVDNEGQQHYILIVWTNAATQLIPQQKVIAEGSLCSSLKVLEDGIKINQNYIKATKVKLAH